MDSLSTRRDRYSGTAKTRNNESPADERRRGKLNVRDVHVWDVGWMCGMLDVWYDNPQRTNTHMNLFWQIDTSGERIF